MIDEELCDDWRIDDKTIDDRIMDGGLDFDTLIGAETTYDEMVDERKIDGWNKWCHHQSWLISVDVWIANTVSHVCDWATLLDTYVTE